MTVAHLVFALATSAYIMIAIQFEERDLVKIHGEEYLNYRSRTPMILPVRLAKGPEIQLTSEVKKKSFTKTA